MPHLSVEHWEESKEQIKSDNVGEVKCKVPLVWQRDGEFFCFFEVRNISQGDNSFTYEAYRIQRNPQSISEKIQFKVSK